MQAVTEELRDDIANFEDTWRPIRSYFYWEKHCYDIPICWSLRSVFDAVDGVDEIDDKFQILTKDFGQLDALDAAADRGVPADDRQHGVHAHHDADHAQHHVRDLQSDGRHELQRQRHGSRFRPGEKRRLVLSAARSVQEQGLQASAEELLLAGRQGGAIDHLASGRSGIAGGHRARRLDHGRPPRSRSRELRWKTPRSTSPAPRPPSRTGRTAPSTTCWIAGIGSLCLIFIIMLIITRSLDRRFGDRGHGGDIVGRVVRHVGAGLAVPPGHQTALDGAGDVGDRPARRRIRLQPAAGVPVERGNPRRAEDRASSAPWAAPARW